MKYQRQGSDHFDRHACFQVSPLTSRFQAGNREPIGFRRFERLRAKHPKSDRVGVVGRMPAGEKRRQKEQRFTVRAVSIGAERPIALLAPDLYAD